MLLCWCFPGFPEQGYALFSAQMATFIEKVLALWETYLLKICISLKTMQLLPLLNVALYVTFPHVLSIIILKITDFCQPLITGQ